MNKHDTLETSSVNRALDTKKLKELCESVIRDIGNDGDVAMAQDWGWANMCYESLPKLKSFLLGLDK